MKRINMITTRHVIISKTIVGLSWVVGLAELAHPFLYIPPTWLYVVMALSLAAHAAQCLYFTRQFGHLARPLWPHLAQIMVFGMPHVLGFQQSLHARSDKAVSA
ncbi:MAG: hypothetical protein HYX44_05695 [Aquabacterium sp.]|nr:hypothetical protein [Aquabacterium sp.]